MTSISIRLWGSLWTVENRRYINTCLILMLSPKRVLGILGSILAKKSVFSDAYSDETSLIISVISSLKSYFAGYSSILLESSLENSRMLLIIFRSWLDDCLIFSASSLDSGSRSSLRISSFIPMMAFIGVLISCVTFARNLLLLSRAVSMTMLLSLNCFLDLS